MNQKCGVGTLSDACRRNTLNRTLEKYISSCRADEFEELFAESSSKNGKKNRRFPNIAGFCRYYRISICDLEALAEEYPEQIGNLYAIFEDEALNSGLPPAVLSAYLKKRLGYDRDTAKGECSDGGVTVRFEHDIFDDGE